MCLLLLQSAGDEPEIRSTHLLFNKSTLRARRSLAVEVISREGVTQTQSERIKSEK